MSNGPFVIQIGDDYLLRQSEESFAALPVLMEFATREEAFKMIHVIGGRMVPGVLPVVVPLAAVVGGDR